MNKRDFIKRVSELLRENNIKKPVSMPKQVFHISDDDGNTKDFTVKKSDKAVLYTLDDVNLIVDACLCVIKDALRQGDSVSIHGFGSIGLNYRKPRMTKQIGSDNDVVISGRYVPKFSFGNDLRRCAKMYELSLSDKLVDTETLFDETDDEGGEEYVDRDEF